MSNAVSTGPGLLLAGGTMTGAIAMGANKVTGLANGTGLQDAAAFGQVPPLPTVTQMGLAGWNYPSILASGAVLAATVGNVLLARVPLYSAPITITNVLIGLEVVGGTLTASENFIGVYDQGGTQIGTSADQTTAWGSGVGVKTAALAGGPFSGSYPFVYVALVANGGTGPSFARAGGGTIGTSLIALNASAANLPFATNGTGATVLPPTLAYGSNIAANSQAIWVGLS
jgi:hypothetical protein